MSNLTAVRIDSDGSSLVTTVSEDMHTLSVFNAESGRVWTRNFRSPPSSSSDNPRTVTKLWAVKHGIFILDNRGCMYMSDSSPSRSQWDLVGHDRLDALDVYLDQNTVVMLNQVGMLSLIIWLSGWSSVSGLLHGSKPRESLILQQLLDVPSNCKYKIAGGVLHSGWKGEKLFLQAIDSDSALVSNRMLVCERDSDRPEPCAEFSFFAIEFPSSPVTQTIVLDEKTICFLTNSNFLATLKIPANPDDKPSWKTTHLELPPLLSENEKYYLFRSSDKMAGIISCNRRLLISTETNKIILSTSLFMPDLIKGEVISSRIKNDKLEVLVEDTSPTGQKSVHVVDWPGDISSATMVPYRHKTLIEGACSIM